MTSAEKMIVDQSVFDKIVEYLAVCDPGGTGRKASFADIFSYVHRHVIHHEDISDQDLSTMTASHLNTLITDYLVVLSSDEKLGVLFGYIVY